MHNLEIVRVKILLTVLSVIFLNSTPVLQRICISNATEHHGRLVLLCNSAGGFGDRVIFRGAMNLTID